MLRCENSLDICKRTVDDANYGFELNYESYCKRFLVNELIFVPVVDLWLIYLTRRISSGVTDSEQLYYSSLFSRFVRLFALSTHVPSRVLKTSSLRCAYIYEVITFFCIVFFFFFQKHDFSKSFLISNETFLKLDFLKLDIPSPKRAHGSTAVRKQRASWAQQSQIFLSPYRLTTNTERCCAFRKNILWALWSRCTLVWKKKRGNNDNRW